MCLSDLISLTRQHMDIRVHTQLYKCKVLQTHFYAFVHTHAHTHRLAYTQGMHGAYKHRFSLLLIL